MGQPCLCRDVQGCEDPEDILSQHGKSSTVICEWLAAGPESKADLAPAEEFNDVTEDDVVIVLDHRAESGADIMNTVHTGAHVYETVQVVLSPEAGDWVRVGMTVCASQAVKMVQVLLRPAAEGKVHVMLNVLECPSRSGVHLRMCPDDQGKVCVELRSYKPEECAIGVRSALSYFPYFHLHFLGHAFLLWLLSMAGSCLLTCVYLPAASVSKRHRSQQERSCLGAVHTAEGDAAEEAFYRHWRPDPTAAPLPGDAYKTPVAGNPARRTVHFGGLAGD